MKLQATLVATAAALAFSSGAFADMGREKLDNRHDQPMPKFEEIDKDRNGSLSKEEAGTIAVDFSAADLDGDGKLSRDEYEKLRS